MSMIENSASKVPYCTKGGKVPDGGKEQSGMAKLDLHILNRIKLVCKFKRLGLHFCTWMQFMCISNFSAQVICFWCFSEHRCISSAAWYSSKVGRTDK